MKSGGWADVAPSELPHAWRGQGGCLVGMTVVTGSVHRGSGGRGILAVKPFAWPDGPLSVRFILRLGVKTFHWLYWFTEPPWSRRPFVGRSSRRTILREREMVESLQA